MFKMFIAKIISVIILSAVAFGTYAQSRHSTAILGRVLDANTKQPLAYATVTVIETSENKKAMRRGMTDNIGYFEVKNVDFGTYRISIDLMGYASWQKDAVSLKKVNPVCSLGTILLALDSSANLRDIVVTSRTPVVVNKIDKVIYNVANDISSQGGMAIDVLKKVPQVSVDADGNVELQGNSNIRFLINGKSSSVFGNSLSDALASIPASEIKSIEVISSPGARYDGQGTGGIINIILKSDKRQGINGNVNVSTGSRLENASLNLNFRHDNFGVNVFFSGNAQLKSKTPFSQARTTWDSSAHTATQLFQKGENDFTRNGYQTGFGMNWSFSKKDNISAAFSYNHLMSHAIGTAQQEQLIQPIGADSPLADVFSFRKSDTKSSIGSYDWNLGYSHKFHKDAQSIEVLYTASYGAPYSKYYQLQTYDGQNIPYFGTSSVNPGTDKQTNISIDYSQPVGDGFALETGVKTNLQDIFSKSDVQIYLPIQNQFSPDLTQSYSLNYKMRVYAVYLSGSFSLFHYFDVIAGARYEYTHVNVDLSDMDIPSYGKWLPSVIISHKINDIQSVKLSYAKRLERPEYKELNPYLNLSDPYNITTGNPLLKPEIANNFELGYSLDFNNGGNIYVALMERINTQDVKPYTYFYPTYTIGDSVYTNVSVSYRQNVGTEYNSGIIINSSIPFGNFNVRENALLFERNMIDNLNGGKHTNAFNWRLNLNANYQFSHDLILEAFGNYRSSFRAVQGLLPQQFTYTIAFRKQFCKKNASIGVTATNPFNKYVNQVITTQTNNYDSYYLRQIPYRSFGISFMYKFGKLNFNRKKDEDSYLNNSPDMSN